MQITEEAWARIGAEVALHETLVVLLVKASPRRDEIVSAARQVGNAAYAGLLASQLPDVQIDQFGDALKRFLGKVEAPGGESA